MVQLATILWTLIVLFAIVGAMRGWTRELISVAGIILALFATWQFDAVLIQPLTRGATPEQIFFLYTGILVVITFFAYQTPTNLISRRQQAAVDRRQGLQERLLGFVLGGVNGYLIFGTIWYYLDRTGYPFAPFIFAPSPDSASAAMVQSLPLIFLVQGNLLTILVVVLFLFVLIAVI
ncbi:MAG: CvpA family protein [Chloroflexi bacterium CFX4]|nr:CvpA family protein [Chloroflexi bacterium CFX4]MDL1923693.1 CvpA family protein [Chloroflexi bacterium CFX3]